MNEIQNENEKVKDQKEKEIIDISKKPKKKLKKKKKAKKKKQEKECKNLKELLEQIQEENEQKSLKEKKLKEKEDEKEKEDLEEIPIKENINNINKSTSGTTTGTLSLDDNSMPNYLLVNYDWVIGADIFEERFDKRRKMSSPILEYYNGCDKFLSKEKEGTIDLTHSSNFIEKKKFICSFSKNKKINKLYINPKDNDVKDEKKKNNKFNNNMNHENEIYYYNNNYDIESKFNTINSNNDIQNMINNINNNINLYYYSNAFSFNSKKQKNRKNEKYKIRKINTDSYKRMGDWTCSHCLNLNFSFRKTCNKCEAPKEII